MCTYLKYRVGKLCHGAILNQTMCIHFLLINNYIIQPYLYSHNETKLVTKYFTYHFISYTYS